MVVEEDFTLDEKDWGKQYREKQDEKLNLVFRIVDFMGEERCHCCDDGWDKVSRSVHYSCPKCNKEHMPGKFHYADDLNFIVKVLKKLNFISISHQVFKKDKFTTSIHFHVRAGTDVVIASADTINQSALKAVVLAIDAREIV